MPRRDDIQAAITTDDTDGALLRVKVVPGASRTRIAGMLGDRLKVQLAAPPEASKANKALCALLAKTFDIGKTDLQITSGVTQPQKTVIITKMRPEEVASRLQRVLTTGT